MLICLEAFCIHCQSHLALKFITPPPPPPPGNELGERVPYYPFCLFISRVKRFKLLAQIYLFFASVRDVDTKKNRKIWIIYIFYKQRIGTRGKNQTWWNFIHVWKKKKNAWMGTYGGNLLICTGCQKYPKPCCRAISVLGIFTVCLVCQGLSSRRIMCNLTLSISWGWTHKPADNISFI